MGLLLRICIAAVIALVAYLLVGLFAAYPIPSVIALIVFLVALLNPPNLGV